MKLQEDEKIFVGGAMLPLMRRCVYIRWSSSIFTRSMTSIAVEIWYPVAVLKTALGAW
jgi:hypothetical protein